MKEGAVLSWWETHRGTLEKYDPSAVAAVDNDANRLRAILRRPEEIVVCVLGQAAVGKSTLLNALATGTDTVLPAGGIGPLTAIATELRYSPEPYFDVRYHDRKVLDGIRLALEGELRRRGRVLVDEGMTEPEAGEVENPLDVLQIDADDDKSTSNKATVEDVNHHAAVERERDNRTDELIRQVRQVVKGNQFGDDDLPELVAGFRLALGLASSPLLPKLCEADEKRCREVGAALAVGRSGQSARYERSRLERAFLPKLKDHVTGPLAPLISELKVGWSSDLLRQGIVFVDLPGVGIASDRYRSVTAEYIRQKARAVILLVDRAGPTEASVELIRESGYWDRLLLASDDPNSDPCDLLLAVSKIDEVAREERRQYESLPPSERPKLRDIFLRLRAEAEQKMRDQAASCFSKLSSAQSDDESVRTAREAAGQALLDLLAVFPLSATEYRDLLVQDEESRPFIQTPEESGVLALQEHLKALAAKHRQVLQQQRSDVADRLARTALAVTDRIHATWTDQTRASKEAAKLREELDRFLEPKRRELANREGAFREFVETSYTTRIDDLVARIQGVAQAEIAQFLSELRSLHWATLRATVTRGGSWVAGINRRLDLPASLAQRFQEPTAAVWGQTLLKDVRSRTKQHASALEQLILEVCTWGEEYAATESQQANLKANRQLAKDQAARLGQVGKDAVDELRAVVKRDLMEQISAPMRQACLEFVERGNAQGAGVKMRILQLFAELGQAAVTAAAKPTTRILKGRYGEVRQEIIVALSDWGDPLQKAADAIVEGDEARSRRESEAQQHLVIKELAAIVASSPVPKPSVTVGTT